MIVITINRRVIEKVPSISPALDLLTIDWSRRSMTSREGATPIQSKCIKLDQVE